MFLVLAFLIVYHSASVRCSVTVKAIGNGMGGVSKLIPMLGPIGKKRTIIVGNRSDAPIRVWCASRDDRTGELRLNRDDNIGFAFTPKAFTLFWCTAEYKGFWARWDAFGGATPSFAKNDQTFLYEVRNDGVYINGKKIRGLAGGKNRYQLWEHYDNNKKPFGLSLTGYVDNDMCNNLPNWMERKTSAVTLCNGQCIRLFDALHCRGYQSKLQPGSGCTNFWLPRFNDKTKSVKGC